MWCTTTFRCWAVVLFYLHDINASALESKVSLSADATELVASLNKTKEIENFSADVRNLDDWCYKNKLSIKQLSVNNCYLANILWRVINLFSVGLKLRFFVVTSIYEFSSTPKAQIQRACRLFAKSQLYFMVYFIGDKTFPRFYFQIFLSARCSICFIWTTCLWVNKKKQKLNEFCMPKTYPPRSMLSKSNMTKSLCILQKVAAK